MPKLTPEQVIKRIDGLKGGRGTLENHWQEIADYIFPRKNDFVFHYTEGQKRNAQVVDNTGMVANELLAGFLHGMLTNPNSQWFELTTGHKELDQRDDVRKWLQDTADRMHLVMNNSNFQTEVHELYLDLTAFGTACMSFEEDETSVVRYATRHLREIFIKENARGRVDEVYREFEYDARQIVSEFNATKEMVGDKVWACYEKGDDKKFKICHAVYPGDYAGSKYRFKYISQYILKDNKKELSFGGFMEFPYAVPRWSKAAGETYGRSPGMTALPEVKTINVMAETVIKGAQKVVDPPLQVPDDGFIKPIRTRPGGISYYRSGTQDFIRPIFNDARIDFGFEAMREKRDRIREAFFVDQMQLNSGPQMTATEVLQRMEERMRLMGPVIGRQNSEFLSPTIDGTFSIMSRRNMFLPPPQVLQQAGGKLSVQYSSMIAKTQRLNEVSNILRTVQTLAPFAQTDPSILDNFDGDQIALYVTRMFNFPQEAIRERRKVKEIREARDEANAQQLQADAATRQADIISKVGPGVAAVANTNQQAV